jgi:hypothetical protein
MKHGREEKAKTLFTAARQAATKTKPLKHGGTEGAEESKIHNHEESKENLRKILRGLTRI